MKNFRHYIPSFADTFLQNWWGVEQADEGAIPGRCHLFNTHKNNDSAGDGATSAVLHAQDRTPLAYGEIFKNYNNKNGKTS
jgi:hypothetical protein